VRLLFEIDKKDYAAGGTVGRRPSVRGIIVKDGSIAMVHSLKYDYYKLPGGGIDAGETHTETLIREVHEETGLRVIPESIREYGLVRRIQKGQREDIFIQENFYYFCDVQDAADAQTLDQYEAEEQFTLEWVTPQQAMLANGAAAQGAKSDEHGSVMIERENRVLQLLLDEQPALFPDGRKDRLLYRRIAVIVAAVFMIASVFFFADSLGQVKDPGSGALMSEQTTFWLHAVLVLAALSPFHILNAIAICLGFAAARSDNPKTLRAEAVVSVISIIASLFWGGMFLLETAS